MQKRRVVVTGLGLVTPSGVGRADTWKRLLAGESHLGPLDAFDVEGFPVGMGGVVRDYDPGQTLHPKTVKQTDRHTWFGMSSMLFALQDSGIDLAVEDPHRVGTVIGNNLGGNVFGEEQLYNLHARGARTVSAYQSIAWFYAATIGQVSIWHGLKGYAKVYTADRASSLLALGDAFRVIQRGDADVIFAGGCEAPFTPYSVVAYLDAGIVARTNGGPERYAPFDRDRQGLILGEGGGVLVLEDREHALRRGAQIHAEVVGFGQTTDGRRPDRVGPDGEQYARAIHLAMAEGAVGPAEIGYIAVDGSGGEVEDVREARAIRLALGDDTPSLQVSCPKTMFGHSIGAANAIDAAIATMVLAERRIPPTVGTTEIDDACRLPLVLGSATDLQASAAVVLGTGRGGVNAALVLQVDEGRS